MIQIDDLLGKTVIGAAGNYIGEVNNADIDSVSWRVTHLHISLSDKAAKEFGAKKALKRSNVRLPISIVNNIGVIITLNKSLTDLKEELYLV